MPCGVKLEQGKAPSLENRIVSLPAPEGLPAPKMFAPLRKKPGAAKILAAAKTACIADELDGEPLGQKLARWANRKIRALCAVCFDDDPLATAAQAVLRENAAEVASGLELAAEVCGAPERRIAAASRGEARRAAQSCPGVVFLTAGDRYPALEILRRRPGAGETGYIGAQACAALAAAVFRGMAQSETVVTVAGDGARKWLNCRTRLGTPVGDVLAAGDPDPEISVVAVGSSVNGRAVTDLSEPVTARTRCVIAMKRAPRRRALPCVGCGRCARACPRRIVPWMILRQLESGAPDPLRLPGVERCIRCEACGVVCPSGIDLTGAVARARAVKGGGAAP